MRRFLPLLCCILWCYGSYAQKTVRYAGYVQMPNDPLVSYYLELTINGNKAHGYSITGYKTGSRLKASVEGYFSTPSDLFIKETGSLDGPNTGILTYCYFSAHLKLTIMMDGKQRWNGQFESHQGNGTPCLGNGGVMTIIDNAPPLDAPAPKVTRTEVPKPVSIPAVPKDTPKPKPKPAPVVTRPKDTPQIVRIIKPAPEAPPKPHPVPELPDSCQRTYDWKSGELSLDIWDGYTIDGDVVSMHINGQALLQHSKLDLEKKHFNIPLKMGLNVLYIELFEEGYDPPNTPNLTLSDGSKSYELAVSGNAGEVVRICIWRR